MDRRFLIVSALASIAAAPALAQQAPSSAYAPPPPPPPPPGAQYRPQNGPPPPQNGVQSTYDEDEIVHRVSDFFGVATESAAGVVEKSFKDQGRPTAYIAGEEGSAAFIGGLRYGKGLLYMKGRPAMKVFWQGPSIGFDAGANGSRVFVLCYNLQYPDAIFRRFPGVDGSAYFIAGMGVNYQRADNITLAPIRSGLGLRLGANIGYLAYSRQRNIIPF
ncbi:MAG: hypothetical protein JWO83_2719 [Caulobacteraceae bacterium]|nr:hypothetical protein [Caulobacteraceae bacterium]